MPVGVAKIVQKECSYKFIFFARLLFFKENIYLCPPKQVEIRYRSHPPAYFL